MTKRVSVYQTFWSPERTEQLKTLVAGGFTAGYIAKGWGVGRNMVIGKMTRMGLKRPEGVAVTGLARYVPDPQLSREAAAQRRAARLASPPISPAGQVDLMGLEPHHCRWPIEGSGLSTLFCGEPKEFNSYCSGHYAMSRNFYRR